MGMKGALLVIVKVLPLAIFIRSACCKFELPVFGCDGPLCPAAIGQPADCEPTANTAELKAWCENGWVPWANGLLEQARTAGVPIPAEVAATCTEADGWHLMKLIGAIEVAGYSLLWINPEAGAFLLATVMAGAVHFHMTVMGDKPEQLILQISLLVASLFVLMFDRKAEEPKAKTS